MQSTKKRCDELIKIQIDASPSTLGKYLEKEIAFIEFGENDENNVS